MTCHVLECHGPPTAGWTIWVSCAGLLGHLGPLGPQAVEGEADIDPRRSNLSHWTWLRAATSATSKCFIVQSLFNFEKKSTSLNLIFSRTFRSRKKIVFLDISTSPGRRDWIHLDEAATPWMKFIPAKAMFDRMFTIMDDLAPFCMFCHPSVTQNSRILTGRILKNMLENLEMEIIQLKSGFAGSKMVNSHVCLQHFPALRIK